MRPRRAAAVGSQATGRPPAGVGGGLGDEQAGHAGEVLGALARRVDVEHDDVVGGGERVRRTRAPGAAVRENRCGWKTATTRRGSSVRAAAMRRGHLGRVVGVVVDDLRARGRAAEDARSAGRRPRSPAAPPRRARGRRRRGAPRSAPRRRCGRCGRPGTESSTATPSSVKREPPGEQLGVGVERRRRRARPAASASSSGRSQITAARRRGARKARTSRRRRAGRRRWCGGRARRW